MTDLILSGTLDLSGSLKLSGDGGRVKVDGDEVLVVGASGTGVPVVQPSPPTGPLDQGEKVNVNVSFNQLVTIGDKPAIAQGISMQGNTQIWPGMVLPSSTNSKVTIAGIPINVKGDRAVTLPNGGSAQLTESGQ